MARRRRWRLGMRGVFILAGSVAIAVGIAIVLLGQRQIDIARRLAAEGEMVQGRYVRSDSASQRGESDRVIVAYSVGGRDYQVSTVAAGNRAPPLIRPRILETTRFGPRDPLQVVYLPGDPSVASLRDDLDVEPLPFYAGGGLFAFVGLVFVLASWLLLRGPED